MGKPTILYIEDLDHIAEDAIYFLKDEFDIVRPPLAGKALVRAFVEYLKNPDYRFDVLLQDLHLDVRGADGYYDEYIHNAVRVYKDSVNPQLCWIILTGSDDLDGAREAYFGVDEVLDKPKALTEDLPKIIKEIIAKKSSS